MFVVLCHVNNYEQCGGYFVGVFNTKEEAEKEFDHFGRRNFEDEWYVCLPIRVGVKYDIEHVIHTHTDQPTLPGWSDNPDSKESP